MKTRQALLVKPGQFEIRQANIKPKDGELLVKMEGCGLCNWELHHWLGLLDVLPCVPGHEGYGVVAAIGPGCAGRVKVGDRVTGLGQNCFADYFPMPEKFAMVVGEDVREKHMPGEPLYCVVNVVRGAHPEAGDVLGIIGCGPMGLWCTMALAHRTLRALIAIDVDDRKLRLARKYGATHLINPGKVDVVAAVKEITGGQMCDVSIEGSGTAAGVRTAIDIARPIRPKVMIMGTYKKNVDIDMMKFCESAGTVVWAHPRLTADVPDGIRRTETLINNGVFKVDPLVTHVFELEKINEAFKALETKPAGFMKGVVTP